MSKYCIQMKQQLSTNRPRPKQAQIFFVLLFTFVRVAELWSDTKMTLLQMLHSR